MPGYNEYANKCHTEARNIYVTRRAVGKPRDHRTRNDMNIARLRFKNAFQQCKLMKDRCRADAMANLLKNNDSVSFWKKSHAI